MSTLHQAFYFGGINRVKELLADGTTDILQYDYYGRQPLHWACENGHTRVARLLLDRGAPLEAFHDSDFGNKRNARKRWRPLHFACNEGDSATASLLIQYGADLEAKTFEGCTPLDLACKAGNLELAKHLVGQGATIESRNAETLLHMVACRSLGPMADFDFAESLLNQGTDVNVKGAYGKTALHVAATEGNTRIVQLLLDRGADTEAVARECCILLVALVFLRLPECC
mmetsp:Transcript_40550/g.97868  ORF Transcript_40550/g.97868 Transcript_40550/m.97868 type:complete len:229 (-) Transcript_40550:3295-3981(-)